MKRTNSVKCQLAILAVAAIVSSAWAQQPGGAYTSTLTRTTATVTAIDAARRAVTIQGEHGPLTVQVKSPEMQQFIRGLKRGDTVQVTFTDSLAVEVLPAS